MWHLVKVGGESFTLPTDEFNIILNENNLGGRGACNSLLGQYATGDKFALRFSHLGSTKMLCPHNEALEMKLIQILSQTTHYDIDGDMLMLMKDGTILAIFKAQAEPMLRAVPENVPEYSEAQRLLRFLEYIVPLQDKEMPPTSLAREFLGGSSFKY